MKDLAYTVKQSETFRWASRDPELIAPECMDSLTRHLVGKTVLDVGCAQGAYTSLLRRAGYRAVGVDISHELVREARRRDPDVPFLSADCTRLCFPDQSFDNAILLDVLEHVDDDRALEEIVRVCRRRVILSVPLKFDPVLGQHGLIFWHYQDTTHRRYYTPQVLRELLSRHGIHISLLSLSSPVELKEALADSLKGPALVRKILAKLISRLPLQTYYQSVFVVGESPSFA